MIHSPRVSSSVQAKLEPINIKTKQNYVDNSKKYEKGPFDEVDNEGAVTFRGKRREELLISAAVRVRLLANLTEDFSETPSYTANSCKHSGVSIIAPTHIMLISIRYNSTTFTSGSTIRQRTNGLIP